MVYSGTEFNVRNYYFAQGIIAGAVLLGFAVGGAFGPAAGATLAYVT